MFKGLLGGIKLFGSTITKGARPWMIMGAFAALGAYTWYMYDKGKDACAAEFAAAEIKALQEERKRDVKIATEAAEKKAEINNEASKIQSQFDELPAIECGEPLSDEWVQFLNGTEG